MSFPLNRGGVFRSSYQDVEEDFLKLDFISMQPLEKQGSYEVEFDIHIVDVDIDIDSDNNNEYGLPDKNSVEDNLESTDAKFILVNNTDHDKDIVPGLADGFNLFDNTETSGDGPQFIPINVKVSVPENIPYDSIKFVYSDSDPLGTVREGNGSLGAPYVYIPEGTGYFRLWKKDGASFRNGASYSEGGDYIPSEEAIPLDQLQLSNGEITFYVEAVRNPQAETAFDLELQLISSSGTLDAISDTVKLSPVFIDGVVGARFLPPNNFSKLQLQEAPSISVSWESQSESIGISNGGVYFVSPSAVLHSFSTIYSEIGGYTLPYFVTASDGYPGDVNEYNLALLYPAEAVSARLSAGTARDWTKTNEVQLGGGIVQGPADAARHCLWNLFMARSFGERIAGLFGDAHERDNVGDSLDNTMDLHNNLIGRNLASYSGSPRGLVVEFLNRGHLVAIVDGEIVPTINITTTFSEYEY